MIHGSRSSPSPRSGPAPFFEGGGAPGLVEDSCAVGVRAGFRRVLGLLGGGPPASAATFPFPFRSRKRAKERQPASVRISERLPAPSFRRAAIKARLSAGVSLASCFRVGAEPRWSVRKLRNCDTSR